MDECTNCYYQIYCKKGFSKFYIHTVEELEP